MLRAHLQLDCTCQAAVTRAIAPKTELRLNDVGVFHYWQIADLDAEQVQALDRQLKLKGQIAKEEWVAQAKKFVDAKVA